MTLPTSEVASGTSHPNCTSKGTKLWCCREQGRGIHQVGATYVYAMSVHGHPRITEHVFESAVSKLIIFHLLP